ncbi:hypothetical protein Q7P37_005127 [Cladosporium fusiforme]
MQLRQFLSGFAIASCAVHGATAKDEPRQDQVMNSPAAVSTKAITGITTATAGANDRTPHFATSFTPEHPVRPKSDDEEYWISSSESVPSERIDHMEPTPSKAGLRARAEEEEPVPTKAPNALPIEPQITPALGIAGAIMLGTGVALCLVGIKKSWLHIFLSTAYLASLAVTVLIIYVMNPDHSNAIQGAYMVAAVVTGLIFGAVSLVFKEVTEGLGCMLGSFCFAMWLLVLAPGGIIHSVAGRGVLIGVLTVVGFGLSFSHYTRMYGLIVCTSFAGSTIIILGVDCFSRAGLKEFWLYLWSLNDKQFPLETNTYPITRGIRVEIACIIVVFLFGLVSQFKLWQVVKEKRTKNEQERKRVEDERAEAEAAVGRDIEANNEKDRAQWEAVYGGKGGSRTHIDSGVGSSVETFGKDQFSVKERELDAIELSDIAEDNSQRRSNSNDQGSAEGGRKSGEMAARNSMESGEGSGRSSQDSMQRSDGDNTHTGEENGETDQSKRAYAPGAPEVVPLPFSVPSEEQDLLRDPDAKSEAPKASIAESKPESIGMPLKKASLRQLDAQFAAGMGQRRDDQESSIAATADDIAMIDEDLPEQQSNINQVSELEKKLPAARSERSHSRQPSIASVEVIEDALDEDDDEALPREPVIIHQETAAPAVAGAHVAPDATEHTQQSLTASKSHHSLSDAAKTQRPDGSSEGHPGSVSESMVHQLPPKLSKIALTYRTNEWAKHIADADYPEDAEDTELARPSSPGVQIDTSFPEEKAKPVDVEALQQTNAPTEPVMPTHKTSKSSKKSKSHRKSKASEQSNISRTPSTQSVTPVYAVNRSASQMSLNRNDSTSSTPDPARPKLGSMRQSSIAHQTLVESPVEDAAETFQYNDFANTTPSVYGEQSGSASTSNLLDERTKMLQRRQTTVSFNGFRSTPSLGLMSGAIPEHQAHHPEEQTPGIMSPTMSSPTLPHFETDDENMTLSQRRSLMHNNQNNQVPTPAQTPTHKPRGSVYSTMAGYDSHQPARQPSTSTAQQSMRLNQWRQTLQADAHSKQPPLVVETNARQTMIDDRRQNEMRIARQKEEQSRRQSAIDEAMRRGHLDGAHRDALRKMQAKASKDGS